MVKLFEKLEECLLKVRFEKCHLFMEGIKYCGHVLHGGMRSPAPSKVDAVRNWPKPKTPKQMKCFLGVVNWYSIYIRNFSNIAAPLMTSLQGKYERVPGVDGRKGRCRVPRERNCIQWTPDMESVFVQLKEALSAECELYIPFPTVNIASMWMHATMESVLSLNNRTLKGSECLALFSAASLKATMGRDKELGAPASKRLMH